MIPNGVAEWPPASVTTSGLFSFRLLPMVAQEDGVISQEETSLRDIRSAELRSSRMPIRGQTDESDQRFDGRGNSREIKITMVYHISTVQVKRERALCKIHGTAPSYQSAGSEISSAYWRID